MIFLEFDNFRPYFEGIL